MGYKSNVYFSTTKAGYGAFLENVADENKARKVRYPIIGPGCDGENGAAEPRFLHELENGVVFGFEGYKWHDTYPEVMAVERAVARACEAGHPFMRIDIGEDWDDTSWKWYEYSVTDEDGNVVHKNFWADGGVRREPKKADSLDADFPHLELERSVGWY